MESNEEKLLNAIFGGGFQPKALKEARGNRKANKKLRHFIRSFSFYTGILSPPPMIVNPNSEKCHHPTSESQMPELR